MTTPFITKLLHQRQRTGTDLVLWLKPQLTGMPLPIQRYDDPFLPYSKAIIAATRDLISAYVFDFAAYLTASAAGAVAVERALAYVTAADDAVGILHGPFTAAYAAAMGETAFAADAVTVRDADAAAACHAFGVGALSVETPLADADGVLTLADAPHGRLSIGEVHWRVFIPESISAHRGDDFADQLRAALHALAAS